MATYANGVVSPNPGAFIPASGAAAWDIVAASADAQLGNRYTKAQADALLAGKAAASHTHAVADVTGLQAALDQAALTAEWAQLADKPTAFPPVAHGHAISDVSGLQAALNGKASTSHTHAQSDVTGLPGMAADVAKLKQDTGGRQIASFLPTYIAGEFMIRRIRDTVYVSLYELQVGETNPGYMIQTGFLPSGFRPALTPYLYYQGTLRSNLYTVGPFRVDRYGGITIYGVKLPANHPTQPNGQAIMSVAVSWPTNDPWPTTLPGTPA